MSNPPRTHRLGRPIRWLLPAVALAIGLDWRGEATASMVTVSASVDAGDGHHCPCGTACSGASCCCEPEAPPKARKVPPWKAAAAARLDGACPCVKAAPCGESGLPSASAVGAFGKAAALADAGRFAPDPAEEALPLPPRCILPPRVLARIDDPPERRARP